MAEPEKNGQEEMKEGDEEEEEYVMLDLDGLAEHIRIPENAPYVLTGLDTLNPILVIDNQIKLIGEYTETIGTCLVFKETEPNAGEEEEVGPYELLKLIKHQLRRLIQWHSLLRFLDSNHAWKRQPASHLDREV